MSPSQCLKRQRMPSRRRSRRCRFVRRPGCCTASSAALTSTKLCQGRTAELVATRYKYLSCPLRVCWRNHVCLRLSYFCLSVPSQHHFLASSLADPCVRIVARTSSYGSCNFPVAARSNCRVPNQKAYVGFARAIRPNALARFFRHSQRVQIVLRRSLSLK